MRYDKEFDVWIFFYEPECYSVGITQYAAEQIGEIAYINFAVKSGDKVKRGDVLAFIESPKTCAEVKSPFDGWVGRVFNNSIGKKCQSLNNNKAEHEILVSIYPDDIADLRKMVSEKEYMEAKK